MEIKNVVVIGGGVLGSQIAYQAAYCGFNVTIWLRSEGSIGRCQPKLDHLKEVYHDTITLMASDEGKTPQNWAIGISDYEDFDKEKCLEKADRAYSCCNAVARLCHSGAGRRFPQSGSRRSAL